MAKIIKRTWLCMTLAIALAGCGSGPLSKPTLTPLPTATSAPTLTAAPTETPTTAPTPTSIPTQTLAPAAVTCPKGTVLRPSVNRCFYATRAPKPEIPYCEQFAKKSDCTSHGCSWNTKVGFCS
jgi:hypothetical protein